MSCRHALANGTCKQCYPQSGTIEPDCDGDSLDGPGTIIQPARIYADADAARRGCWSPELRSEKSEQYVLVVYMPDLQVFNFVRPDNSDDLSLDCAERAALTWNSSFKGSIQLFCIGIVPLRDYEEVRPSDVAEALQWFEDRRRWRRQYSEPAPADVFVQIFDPLNMSYGHCLGSEVPTNASWQPVGNVRDVVWTSDTASQREQKLQDENQALRDQLQLLEKRLNEQCTTCGHSESDCH